MRAKNPFTTITSSGMLLPIDLLVRIADGDARLPGLTPDAYHLRSGERLNEAASRAWTQCKAAWDSFRRKLAAIPASDTATTLTRNEWLLPLFQELDYGRLQPKPAIVIDEKTYPVSHRWEEHVPIHLLSARYALDKRTAGVDGAATRSPYSMVQELLNRSGKFRWGMVSNGMKLYLLRDNNSLSRAANVEFDLEAMMDGEVYADFMLLWLLCHQSRVEILSTGVGGQVSGFGGSTETQGAGKKAKGKGKASGKTAKSATRKTGKLLIDDEDDEDSSVSLDTEDDPDLLDEVDSTAIPPTPDTRNPTPDHCWLERWTKEAESRGTRAREKLRNGVENAINALGAGFLEIRGNEVLKHRLTTGALDKQDYYRQLLRMVYRLLLLMFAEEKKNENGQNLLHPPGTLDSVRQRYAKFYSVGRLRDLAGLRRGTSHTDLYESLKVLFEKLREGYEPLGIPGLGSFLFSKTATPDLDNAHLSNVAVLDCFRQLGYTDDDSKSRRVVDFGNLGSEDLGSVYESLLELHPKINSDKGPFILDSAAGSERKTTGSYYTPTSLINCLLDSALDPVVNDAINVSDPVEAERRLLNLKVCDPACGSGHFLIAAAERLAVHLARLRTGDDQPPTMVIQHAKRDIIGRCIYGVDLNPMAVELCKVSLWMEALDPGRPLSFLDHHVQCGNSLLGTTPALLKQGIPDDAFTPIEGDVKAVCADLKKRNKRERADRESGQGYLFESYIKLGNLPSEFTRLSSDSDDSVAAVEAKAKRYAELVSGVDYLNAQLLADTWCAAFVWKKDTSDLGKLCLTERDFRNIEDNPRSVLPYVKSEVRRLADQYQFFHWHLAFPDVFRMDRKVDGNTNELTGWIGGFSTLLGNPPWEHTELKEKEWFAASHTEISNAKTGAARKRLIAALEDSEPDLYERFIDARRHHTATAHVIANSGGFPLCGRGRINTYAIFAELIRRLMSETGASGCIVPTGIATDDTTKFFFQDMMKTHELRSLFSFREIRRLFPGTDSRNPFCLLSMSKHSDLPAIFVFSADSTTELTNEDRRFTLTYEDISRLSPNTQTSPTFYCSDDALLAKHIYRRVPILSRDGDQNSGWGVTIRRLFNMGIAAVVNECFEHANEDVSHDHVMLAEAKLMQQYDHRFASYEASGPNDVPPISKQNPYQGVRPRFWIRKATVDARIKDFWSLAWLLAWRNITNSASERTVLTAAIPYSGADFSLRIGFTAPDVVNSSYLLIGCLNSFPLDYCCRQKIGGNNLSDFITRQLPVLPPESHAAPCNWDVCQTVASWIRFRVLELTYTAWDLEAFALDCSYDGPPFRWDEERRFLLRCELDAAYFHLYLGSPAEWGNDSPQLREMFPTPRHAVEYIMETFPIVKRKDVKAHGDYRTKLVILDLYDQMQQAIESGSPFHSQLDPPEGPPTDSEGNFIPMADWDQHHWPSHIHPPRNPIT